MYIPVRWDANYDSENNDRTNALRSHRFKLCDFSTLSYDIVPYAGHFLYAKFFPK